MMSGHVSPRRAPAGRGEPAGVGDLALDEPIPACPSSWAAGRDRPRPARSPPALRMARRLVAVAIPALACGALEQLGISRRRAQRFDEAIEFVRLCRVHRPARASRGTVHATGWSGSSVRRPAISSHCHQAVLGLPAQPVTPCRCDPSCPRQDRFALEPPGIKNGEGLAFR